MLGKELEDKLQKETQENEKGSSEVLGVAEED